MPNPVKGTHEKIKKDRSGLRIAAVLKGTSSIEFIHGVISLITCTIIRPIIKYFMYCDYCL